MNFSELFIKRPVSTTLLTLGIVVIGIMTYPLLPVSDLPNVDFPAISVSANLSGASPETMASSVATPLEKQFSTISGLDSMSSSSTLGKTQITLTFNLEKNIDAAAQDVQAAISRTLKQLPPEMTSPPTYTKVNPADQPIMYIALTSPTLPMYEIDQYAQNVISQRIAMINGVAQVLVFGTQKYAVRIKLDPKKIAAMNIGIDEVQAALENANVNIPSGSLDSPGKSYTIQAKGQLYRAEAYNKIVVAWRDGRPVRLEDIGTPEDSVENDKIAVWFCGKNFKQRSIMLAVQRQPGTNTVQVADAVKKLLPDLQAQLPASIRTEVMYDRSASVTDSVNEVTHTMILTLFLVVIVIFIFLRNVRSTIIPSLSLPMSILGTFVVMYLLGYSLDNLSLMALTLAIGFVVDDAIVMLENIYRHVESGKTVMQAALDGSKEITFTVLSMTLSLAAVFIPVLFMGGIVGRLFREFAMTIGMSVLISCIVAMTLIPMLCSRFMKRETHHNGENIKRGVMLNFYERTLRWNIRHSIVTAVFSIMALAAVVYLFKIVPKGFLPSEDQSRLMVNVEGPQGISFQSLKEHQEQVVKILQEEPGVKYFMSRIGASNSGTANNAFCFVKLLPPDERKLSADEMIPVLRKKFAEIPGIKVFAQNIPPIQIGGRSSKAQYQYTLYGTEVDVLYGFAREAEKEMQNMKDHLVDISSDLQTSLPQVDIHINRDKSSMLGISAGQIENALYSAYGSRQISTIYAADNQYSVLLELLPEWKDTPEALSLLYVRASSGQLVPLEDLVTRKLVAGPMSVNHTGQLPSVTISFNLKSGVALGDATKEIEKKIGAKLPAGVSAGFQGTAQAFQDSMKGMGLLLLMTVMVIYITLGVLYESYIHPLTILTALPFAGLGALLSLYIMHIDLTVYAFIGIIMLVGIVKKNGIMMVDFAIVAREKENKSPEDAIVDACLIRCRPIMMTTFAALMAAIPLAIGWGTGSEARRPLGITVVGGLLFSQFLTLYVTPVFYVWMEKLRHRKKN